MSENDQNTENSENNEEEKKDEVVIEEETTEDAEVAEKPKSKFTFVCTKCDACCLERGPIPITFWDLELWARNGVIANFMPYLEIYNKPDGTVDLMLKPLPSPPKEGEPEPERDPFGNVPLESLLEEKCPLYDKDNKKCLVYDNRPLSCRTYPLEYDGKNFTVVDVDCPGIGQEGMSKDDLKEMRDTAKTMYFELTRMRIAIPVLRQIISQKVMMDLMRQNLEAMSKLSDEDRQKLDEILRKGDEQPHEHDHVHEDAD